MLAQRFLAILAALFWALALLAFLFADSSVMTFCVVSGWATFFFAVIARGEAFP